MTSLEIGVAGGKMDLPIFCLIDSRLVKVVADEFGRTLVLMLDPVTRVFIPRMDLLERVALQDEQVRELTEEEFESHLAQLAPDSSLQAG